MKHSWIRLIFSGVALAAIVIASPAAAALTCKPAQPAKWGFFGPDERSGGRAIIALELIGDGRALIPKDARGGVGDYVLEVQAEGRDGDVTWLEGVKRLRQPVACVGGCAPTRFELKVKAAPDSFDGDGRPLPERRGLIVQTQNAFSEELGFAVETKLPTVVLCVE